MTDYPTVTVIVNTYKRPVLLRRALASVKAQTYSDYEIIIVHDGPIDKETEDTITPFANWAEENDKNLLTIGLSENSGYQCVPKNVGTHAARGDYIAYLDDDNEWTPDHLEILVNAIEEGEDWPDFVYGRRAYIKECESSLKLPLGKSPYIEWNQAASEQLARGPLHNFIDGSDLLISKGALWRLQMATTEMWKESLRRFADWELMVRGVFFSGWKGKSVNAIVQRYYWHGDNIQMTRPINETPKRSNL